jgi:hypothetical protein
MNIDWMAFTPWSALAGGAVIGLAAAMFALVNGRIAGVSGIVGGLLRPSLPDASWRAAFVAGLIVAPIVYVMFAQLPPIVIDGGYPVLILAGLLVGVGTRYGAGCTSGHGVCGLSRASPRSLVATLAFMAAGFVTVFVVRHVIAGCARSCMPSSRSLPAWSSESDSSSRRWRAPRKCSGFSISPDAGIRRSLS